MEERSSEEKPVETAKSAQAKAPRKKNPKVMVAAAVVAAVVVAAGAGFWVWHETPGFCGAICHYSMDSYLATYEQDAGVEGMDKYGNTVANTNGMLAVSHEAEDLACLDCHVPTMSEQVAEGVAWVSGNYEVVEAPGTVSGYALSSRSLADLTEARGASADEFCLNESCHNLTREQLVEETSDLSRNPHDDHHGEQDCGTCHKAHSASVMYCSQCHEDSPQPEGWLTWAEYRG